ncbi:MAG: glutathione S-transferase family protein [Alphaproteobacteria bacterium]
MLQVWGRKSSSNVQAVMWCIAELGLAYERIDAGFTYGVVDTPAYRSMNPNGTVPTLVDGDNPPLWESGAILRYLANVYAPESFWPSDLVRRAETDKWAEWSKLNIALGFTRPIFWQVVRTAPSKRNMDKAENALTMLSRHLDIADEQLAVAPFLAGHDLTLADIQFGHCLFRYYDIDIDRQDHANVRAYYDRLCGREAYREHVMVSYEELRVFD